jgi:hypothetical protein
MSQAGEVDVIGNHPEILTQVDADTGSAVPVLNILNILGTAAVAGLDPVFTTASGNTVTISVQLAQASATTSASKAGIAAFNSADFSVNADGFVSLLGGGSGIDSIGTQTGTNPIVPDGAGLVTINGAVVAAGTNPVRSHGTGANTMALEVQTSQAIAATDATKIGLCNFDSSDFAVDANGFVTFTGASATTCIFSAYLSSTQSNVTGDGTVYTIPFNTALVNLSGSYNTGTGIFTAPTTGNYFFTCSVNVDGLLTTHTDGILSLSGSNYENRFFRCNFGAIASSGIVQASGSVIIPMTAGQTMSVFAFAANGTKVVDIIGAAAPGIYTNFSGYLIP